MLLTTKPTAILFDWDNTLVDTWPMIQAGMRAVFENRGLTPWTLQEVKEKCHASGREAFPKLFPDDWQSALDDFYEHVRDRHLNDITLLPFVHKLLEQLIAHEIPIGIVSNKTKALLVKEIDHFGFSNYFRTIIGAGDAVRDKPDAAPLLMALEQLEVEPSMNVWMIGDTPVDWQAAHAASVYAIGIGACPENVNNIAPNIMFNDLEPIYESIATCT
jgi:phosphoglycolate phosphatase